MTSDQANGNIDWQINSKDRLSSKYYYQNDPVTLPYAFSQTGGFPVTATQRLAGRGHRQHHRRQPALQLGAAPGLLPPVRLCQLSSKRSPIPTAQRTSGSMGQPRSPRRTAMARSLTAACPACCSKDSPAARLDSPGVKVGPYSSFADMGFYQNRLNPSTNLIFTKGNHTIRCRRRLQLHAVEYRKQPQRNRAGLQTSNFDELP